ncbi:MAG TPA: single-stranded DNA-binding protein [Trebonia sp.]|jgi:single-strand DNA-binding protein|nr:single-stranded DNA-binding protein [Trebonia sp.]
MTNAFVTVRGFVAMDPKLWFTKQAQTPVVNLRVGATTRRVEPGTGEWRDGPSFFFTVTCWRKLAVNVHASLKKGDPVIVAGRLRTRAFEADGKSRTVVEIEADTVGHDIVFGWSHFVRSGMPASVTEAPGGADGRAATGAGSGTEAGAAGGPGGFSAPGDFGFGYAGDGADAGSADAGSADGGFPDGGFPGGGGEDGPGLDEAAVALGLGVPDGELAAEGRPF